MPEHKPLYLYSLKEAAEWDEKDEWRESYLENCDCARAIERAIDEHYDGQCLNSCAQEIIDRYGFDRVNFVLAATVRQGMILSILVYTFFSRMFDLCCLQ